MSVIKGNPFYTVWPENKPEEMLLVCLQCAREKFGVPEQEDPMERMQRRILADGTHVDFNHATWDYFSKECEICHTRLV